MLKTIRELNIYRFSLITGLIVSIIGMFIAFFLSQFGELTGLYYYREEDLEIYSLSWSSIIVFAPVIESIIVILLIHAVGLFTSNERAALIVVLLVSLLHGFSSWITAIAVIPLFAISVLSFFKFKKNKLYEGYLVIFYLHFVNNSFVLLFDYILKI